MDEPELRAPPPVEILLDAPSTRQGARTAPRANAAARRYPGRLLEVRMATSRDPRGSHARRRPRRLCSTHRPQPALSRWTSKSCDRLHCSRRTPSSETVLLDYT
jgi:hypothetical protein